MRVIDLVIRTFDPIARGLKQQILARVRQFGGIRTFDPIARGLKLTVGPRLNDEGHIRTFDPIARGLKHDSCCGKNLQHERSEHLTRLLGD